MGRSILSKDFDVGLSPHMGRSSTEVANSMHKNRILNREITCLGIYIVNNTNYWVCYETQSTMGYSTLHIFQFDNGLPTKKSGTMVDCDIT